MLGDVGGFGQVEEAVGVAVEVCHPPVEVDSTTPEAGVVHASLPPGAAGGTTYRVHGVSRPGGHGKIRCNTTEVKADTGSISDGNRPGPADLLCAALAACVLKNVERYSELLPFHYEAASVTVEAERRDAPPALTRMHYRLELVTDEPAHRIELLHRNVRKFGTITNTLAAALDLTGEIATRNPGEEPELNTEPV